MEKYYIRNIIREALYKEDFKFDNQNKSFTPPPNVVSTAQNALLLISKNDLTSHGGNEGSGKNKAKELSQKKPQNFSLMKRLKAYFDNNQQEYNKEKSTGKNINNSGIIQSWDLHGGDACKNWVNSELSKTKQNNLGRKKIRRDTGGAGNNKGAGIFSWKKMMDPTNTRIKK